MAWIITTAILFGAVGWTAGYLTGTEEFARRKNMSIRKRRFSNAINRVKKTERLPVLAAADIEEFPWN